MKDYFKILNEIATTFDIDQWNDQVNLFTGAIDKQINIPFFIDSIDGNKTIDNWQDDFLTKLRKVWNREWLTPTMTISSPYIKQTDTDVDRIYTFVFPKIHGDFVDKTLEWCDISNTSWKLVGKWIHFLPERRGMQGSVKQFIDILYHIIFKSPELNEYKIMDGDDLRNYDYRYSQDPNYEDIWIISTENIKKLISISIPSDNCKFAGSSSIMFYSITDPTGRLRGELLGELK